MTPARRESVDTAALRRMASAALASGGTIDLYPATVRALCDAYEWGWDEHDRAERLEGMAEWLGEVVVDARDACQRVEGITPKGSPDWVESGIAMRKTVLYEVRKVLDRERNASPSRYDAMKAERDAARAELQSRELHHFETEQSLANLIAELEALCDDQGDFRLSEADSAELRAVIARHKEAGA